MATVREPMPTLIGVAPAAPIVTGRPSSSLMRVASQADAAPVSSREGPSSRVRPRVEPEAQDPRPVAAPPSPKHTFDAIALGEGSPAISSRSRIAAPLLALLFAAALVVVGVRVTGIAHRAAPTSAPVAVAAPAPIGVGTSAAVEPPMAVATTAPPPTQASAAPVHPKEPAKTKRTKKAPPRHKPPAPRPSH
jgi:hypothetical protein